MRILVVDDDPGVRESLRRVLALDDHEVELAGDGAQALERLADGAPDAIILDLAMPHLDGLEVCERVRGSGNELPILIVSASGDPHAEATVLAAGASAYLAKPFALDELRAWTRTLRPRDAPRREPGAPSHDLPPEASSPATARAEPAGDRQRSGRSRAPHGQETPHSASPAPGPGAAPLL